MFKSKAEREAEEAQELLNRIGEVLDSDIELSPEQREEFEIQKAALAGIILRPWLPAGIVRKILMLILLYVGISNAISGSIFWLLVSILALAFSPHAMGLLHLWAGVLSRYFEKEPTGPEVSLEETQEVEKQTRAKEAANIVLFMAEQIKSGMTDKEQLVEEVHQRWAKANDSVQNTRVVVDELYPYALAVIKSPNES